MFFSVLSIIFIKVRINVKWEQRKLGEVILDYKRKNNNDRLPVLTSSFQGIEYQEKHFGSQQKHDTSDYNVLPKEYMTYRNRSDNGYFRFNINNLGVTGIVSKFYPVFTTINTNKLFLASYINHNHRLKNHFKVVSVGTSQHVLSLRNFKKTNLLFPSKDEQDQIGKFFNLLNRAITLQQRKLEQLRQLKIFTLQRMFIDKDCKQPILRFKNFNDNWLPHKFNDIANTFSGGTPAISNKDYYGGNIPFIRSAEINKNTTQLHLTPDGLKNSSAKFIKKGTLLYALYGATSGEVGIAQIDGAINQAVMAINLKKDNVYFIKTWLIKNKRKIISTYLQGGQGNLSAKIVKHLKLSLPKIEEEKLISITIMKIDSLIKLQQSKIDDLVNLKKYLLQKLFI
ncbi:restriction endonuclease subunit S [Limosilactobacillus reuteri]|uniref:restriction endonuclease subunit S n=1 Tax=Limosilactobacillus reuteri TaxID=1598 RepID=UPI002F267146